MSPLLLVETPASFTIDVHFISKITTAEVTKICNFAIYLSLQNSLNDLSITFIDQNYLQTWVNLAGPWVRDLVGAAPLCSDLKLECPFVQQTQNIGTLTTKELQRLTFLLHKTPLTHSIVITKLPCILLWIQCSTTEQVFGYKQQCFKTI